MSSSNVFYKLVSQDYTTYNGMKWELGKTNRALGIGTEMCTDQVLHCYNDPYLAVMFNPIHANIKNPRLLEIQCSPIVNSDGLKFACKEQTPVKEISLPSLTTNQRVAFALKCALLVYKAAPFVEWATKWLSGENRAAKAAADAADAAYAAAYAAYAAKAAANAAAKAAANAAADAADAAKAAANAAKAANAAAYAAKAAADAADAAAYAAYAADAADAAADAANAAAYAANAAAYAAASFKSIMEWVLENVQ